MNRSARNVFPIIFIAAGLIVLLAVGFWIINSNTSSPAATPTNQIEIPFPEIPRVRLPDAKAAFDIKNAVFLDVRGDPFFAQGHIPGAVSIPLTDLTTRLSELNKNDWIIPYCT